jgi:hypothetical protein
MNKTKFTKQNRKLQSVKEAGNVFFLVIVGVALFAALGVTFSRGTRTGKDRISEKRAELFAQDILSYAQLMSRSTDRVIGRSVSESDISFENNIVTTGYTNANCADDTCKIFSSSGGGAKYKEPDDDWLDSSFTGDEGYGEWRFTRAMCVEDLGGSCNDSDTNDDELVMILPYVKITLCKTINKNLQISTSTIPSDPDRAIPDALEKYDGDAPDSSLTLDDTGSLLTNKTAGCFESAAGTLDGAYTFYQVLIER